MTKTVTPIFLISLPRSGSTFLQKILMSHPEISSTGEPWFLLPLVYMQKSKGVKSEYGHRTAVNAFSQISVECGQNIIDTQIRNFAEAVYKRYCNNGEKFFLDKTPRYYNILDDLIRIFPGAYFVVLLRNPISIFASSIDAFRNNSMRRLDHLDRDFKIGPQKIGSFAKKYRDKIHILNYEELVSEPRLEIEKICKYLGIEYSVQMIEKSFDVQLSGYGDHLGAKNYKTIVKNDNKWLQIINTRYRKKRLIKYLKKYPKCYLSISGHEKKRLLEKVQNTGIRDVDVLEFVMFCEEQIVRICKIILKKLQILTY